MTSSSWCLSNWGKNNVWDVTIPLLLILMTPGLQEVFMSTVRLPRRWQVTGVCWNTWYRMYHATSNKTPSVHKTGHGFTLLFRGFKKGIDTPVIMMPSNKKNSSYGLARRPLSKVSARFNWPARIATSAILVQVMRFGWRTYIEKKRKLREKNKLMWTKKC